MNDEFRMTNGTMGIAEVTSASVASHTLRLVLRAQPRAVLFVKIRVGFKKHEITKRTQLGKAMIA
ncbi:MAG TPA: hypothetical protein VG347_09670 [Verrucomicrobiae bacterium]|nr:hypothetical protein [Verrucomicrobiae bacterium]